MADIEHHVQRNTPRCLGTVRARAIEPFAERGDVAAAYSLSRSVSAETVAEILGFDLSDYNRDYAGPVEFISPLALRWKGTKESDIVFDSDIHGYHGELQASAKLRGDGEPKTFVCPACGNSLFGVSMQFDYSGACEDLRDDEPDLPIQDYFSNIVIRGMCVECGAEAVVLDMDV